MCRPGGPKWDVTCVILVPEVGRGRCLPRGPKWDVTCVMPARSQHQLQSVYVRTTQRIHRVHSTNCCFVLSPAFYRGKQPSTVLPNAFPSSRRVGVRQKSSSTIPVAREGTKPLGVQASKALTRRSCTQVVQARQASQIVGGCVTMGTRVRQLRESHVLSECSAV